MSWVLGLVVFYELPDGCVAGVCEVVGVDVVEVDEGAAVAAEGDADDGGFGVHVLCGVGGWGPTGGAGPNSGYSVSGVFLGRWAISFWMTENWSLLSSTPMNADRRSSSSPMGTDAQGRQMVIASLM